jgi:hypothetical protein
MLIALGVLALFIILLFRESYEEGVREQARKTNARESVNPMNSLDQGSGSFSESRVAVPEEDSQKKCTGCLCDIPEDISRGLLFTIVLVFFSFSVGLSLNETILTPLARDSFGMSVEGTRLPLPCLLLFFHPPSLPNNLI